MDEKFVGQVVAELIEQTGQALGLVVAAMSRKMDAEALAGHLRAQLAADKQVQGSSPAQRIAGHALQAVEAELLLRKSDAQVASGERH